jgi:hypothetical protein
MHGAAATTVEKINERGNFKFVIASRGSCFEFDVSYKLFAITELPRRPMVTTKSHLCGMCAVALYVYQKVVPIILAVDLYII